MTHRNIKIIFYKGSLRCVQDSCERETNIIGSFGNLLSLTIANRWHTPFWQLFRQVSQIPNPLGNVRSSSNRAIDKLLVYVCVPRFDMVDMVDMESCQAYGHIMVGLGGWMIWLTTLWNAWQIAKGWFATFFAFFCACLLLFVDVAFLLLFGIVGLSLFWLGYWQNVLLVIVCLMDQTILIEFNYIACACPLSMSRWLFAGCCLLLVLVICNNFELLPLHSCPCPCHWLTCEICRCHGLLICADVLAKPSIAAPAP